MKNIFLPASVILIILLILSSCTDLGSFYQKPKATVNSVEISEVTFSSIKLIVNIKISNPNSMGITLSGYDYYAELADKRIIEGKREEKVSIKAKGESIIPIPVKLKYSEIIPAGSSIIKDNSIKITLGAGLNIAIPYIGTLRTEVKEQTELPIIRPPVILPVSLKVNYISLTGADFEIKMNIKNPNSFDMTINKAEGSLIVADKEWGKIKTEDGAWIPGDGTVILDLHGKVDFASVGRYAWSLLTGHFDTNISVDGTLDANMEIPGFKNSRIPWDSSAKVSIIR